MLVKYNKKAVQHISSTIDYYLEHFGQQATTNLAHEIDEKAEIFILTQISQITQILRQKPEKPFLRS